MLKAHKSVKSKKAAAVPSVHWSIMTALAIGGVAAHATTQNTFQIQTWYCSMQLLGTSNEVGWQSLLMLGCSCGETTVCTTLLASDLEDVEQTSMLLSQGSSNLCQELLQTTNDALPTWLASRKVSTILYIISNVSMFIKCCNLKVMSSWSLQHILTELAQCVTCWSKTGHHKPFVIWQLCHTEANLCACLPHQSSEVACVIRVGRIAVVVVDALTVPQVYCSHDRLCCILPAITASSSYVFTCICICLDLGRRLQLCGQPQRCRYLQGGLLSAFSGAISMRACHTQKQMLCF